MKPLFLAAAILGAAMLPAAGNGKPCGEHTGAAKKACAKQLQRDRMDWPPRPTNAEVIRRIGLVQWRKAERVAQCETGGNWQHYPHGTYTGGLGMYRGTMALGLAVTRYRWPHQGATKAEQIATGYVVAMRFGWSAWGCGSA